MGKSKKKIDVFSIVIFSVLALSIVMAVVGICIAWTATTVKVADLLGGSVCNGMTTLTGYPNIKLIAGMNMGLVISLILSPGALSDEEIDAKILEAKDMNHRVLLEKTEDSEEDFF